MILSDDDFIKLVNNPAIIEHCVRTCDRALMGWVYFGQGMYKGLGSPIKGYVSQRPVIYKQIGGASPDPLSPIPAFKTSHNNDCGGFTCWASGWNKFRRTAKNKYGCLKTYDFGGSGPNHLLEGPWRNDDLKTELFGSRTFVIPGLTQMSPGHFLFCVPNGKEIGHALWAASKQGGNGLDTTRKQVQDYIRQFIVAIIKNRIPAKAIAGQLWRLDCGSGAKGIALRPEASYGSVACYVAKGSTVRLSLMPGFWFKGASS